MPHGDRTGPKGEGPMTGRKAGYCAGGDKPGFENKTEKCGAHHQHCHGHRQGNGGGGKHHGKGQQGVGHCRRHGQKGS